MSRSRKYTVRVCKHPIDRSAENLRVIKADYRGQSIRQVAERYARGKCIIVLDGKEIPQESWGKTRVRIGCVIDVIPNVGFLFFFATAAAFWSTVGTIVVSSIIGIALSYLGGKLFGQDLKESDEDLGSSNYAWNPSTIRREGVVKPRLYGETMVHGNAVAQWTDVVDGDEVLYSVIDHGEGPIEGLGSNIVYLNDQPIGNYTGATVQERLGTMGQTCMTGFEETKVEYTLGWDLTASGGALTFTTPNDWADDLEFTFAFPNGLIAYYKDGSTTDMSVQLKIELSPVGQETWTTVYNSTTTDKTRKPFYLNLKLSEWRQPIVEGSGTLLDPYVTVGYEDPFAYAHGTQYDVRFTRLTQDDKNYRFISVCQLKSVREVANVAFTRPGRALLGIRAVGTQQLSGNLDVKCVRKGRIVNVYDGTDWNLQYSNLRAWIVLDTLTQPVISGSGESGDPYIIERYEGLDPANVDLAFFYEWAQVCDTQVPDGKGGIESLFTCDYNLDTKRSVYSVACELAELGRVKLYWEGTLLTGWIDAAVATDSDLVTADNIMAKSWRNAWNGKDEMAGTINVAYQDKDRGYERTTYFHSNANSGVYTRVIDVEASGETRRSGAVRMADFALNRNALVRNVNTFEMLKDAMRYRLGDVIRLQARRPNWGVNYRIVDVDSGLQSVMLDRTVTGVQAGDLLYARAYDDNSGTQNASVDVYTVASVSGKTVTLQETFSPVPSKNYIAAVGMNSSAPVRRRIIKIVQRVNNHYEVTVETYDPNLYIRDSISPTDPHPNYVWPAPAKRNGLDNKPINWENILNAIDAVRPPQPDIDIPWISNCEWTYDSGGGTVYWNPRDADSPITFRYQGTTYEITPGSTTDEFVYWDPDYTTTFQHSALASVAIASGHWLVCGVVGGVVYPSTPIQFLHAGVILAGTIRANMYAELRQTLPFGPFGKECDATYPFVFKFQLPTEMTSLISVKLSFAIMPFRATSTGASSGGGSTITSATVSATVGTSGAADHFSTSYTSYVDPGPGDTGYTAANLTYTEYADGTSSHHHGVSENYPYHRHSIGSLNHRHEDGNHPHDHNITVPSHDHFVTLPNHTHGIIYGIYEYTHAVNVTFKVNNGSGYGAASASYNTDQTDIDITSLLSGAGWKSIQFTVDNLCEIVAIVNAKVDITA
jgi:hypothetical protein